MLLLRRRRLKQKNFHYLKKDVNRKFLVGGQLPIPVPIPANALRAKLFLTSLSTCGAGGIYTHMDPIPVTKCNIGGQQIYGAKLIYIKQARFHIIRDSYFRI